jgi:hypothetical protein
MSRLSENVGASTSRNPKGLHGLQGDNFTLPKFFSCVDNLSADQYHYMASDAEMAEIKVRGLIGQCVGHPHSILEHQRFNPTVFVP